MPAERILTVVNIVAMLLAAVAFYFSDASALKERIAIAETKMEQETKGYYVLQSGLGQRLDGIERKLDCLMDRRLCH